MPRPDQEPKEADELLFVYGQLHDTIVQNYLLALQILGATLLFVTALVGLAFSEQVDTARERAGIFLAAETLTASALLQSIDRGRSTNTMASYLRVFVEPRLTHAKWETRLLQFRQKRVAQGIGGFLLGQWALYAVAIVANFALASYYGWRGFSDSKDLYRGLAHVGSLFVTLYVLAYSLDLFIKFELKQSEVFDAKWEEIKASEVQRPPDAV